MKLLHIMLFVCTFSLLFSQAGMYSEQEIEEQTDFIQAFSLVFDEDYQEAVVTLDKLLENAPDKSILYARRAKAYASMEDFEKAYVDIRKAIKFDPTKLNYYQIKYDIENVLEKFEEQVQTCEKLVELDPQNIFNYYDLYNSLRNIGNQKRALEVLELTEQHFGINERIANSKILLLDLRNDDEGISEVLRALVDENPYETQYLHKLAAHLLSIDKEGEANEVFNRIIQIDPSDSRAMQALSQSNTRPDPQSSSNDLMDLVANEEVSINTKILRLIPYIQNMSGDPEKPENVQLEKLLITLKQLHPSEAKAYSISGDYYYNTSQISTAIQEYKKTLELDDHVFDVWAQLLSALYYEAQFTELLDYAENTIDLFPNKIDGYYYYALASIYTGNRKDALMYRDDALLMTGQNPYWISKLESIEPHGLYHSGETNKALTDLNEMGGLVEKDAITAKLYGDVLSKADQKSRAVEYWNKAIKLGYKSALLKEQIDAAGS